MHVQIDTPAVPDPLATLTDDYGHAVLHIAWDLHTQTKERTLLFAFVELLPHEVPAPIDDYDPKAFGRLTNASDHRVYVRHAVVTPEQALSWYLACRIGDVAMLPTNDGRLPANDDPAAVRLALARIGEDPPWPALVTWSPEHTALPFCPHWVESPRVHSLVPLAPFDLHTLWSTPREREAAADKLHDLLHFDLRENPELWGSVHLLAPNPVYREMDARRRYGIPPAESEVVRFQPRAGKRVEGLELLVQERRPWGPADVRRVTVQSPLLELQHPAKIRARRTEVWDPLRGMLESPDAEGVFLDGFQVSIGSTRSTRVRGRAPEDHYEVNRVQHRKIHVGETEPPAESAYTRLMQAHFQKRSQSAAKSSGQRWFRGEKQEAHDYLRSLLSDAHREVWLIDPYFGADELIGFLPAIANVEVPIWVLTSAAPLREKDRVEPTNGQSLRGASQVQEEVSDRFAGRLPALRKELENPLQVRVMTGKPDIHDRFLVIDDRVFSIGSSLNELGERGTIVLGVPDPQPIRESLYEAWNNAQDFEPWYESRKANRAAPVAEEGAPEAAE